MWKALSPRTQDIIINVGTALAGIGLAFSPWLLGFAATWATWSALLLGSAIALVALKCLIIEEDWEAFAKIALGIWAAISPAMLSFTPATGAALAHLFLGGAATTLAALGLWLRDHRPFSTM